MVSLKERNLRFLGVRNLQETGSKVEDNGDVAVRTEKVALDGVYNLDSFSALSDKGHSKEHPPTEERRFLFSNFTKEDCLVKSAIENQLLVPTTSAMVRKEHAQKIALDLQSPEITLKNTFVVLSDTESNGMHKSISSQTVGLGQAHLISEKLNNEVTA